ncbi:hypothetical protein [Luteimonas fraxinea]|nr:hypothetical protein [Luteimonas fraxinea]
MGNLLRWDGRKSEALQMKTPWNRFKVRRERSRMVGGGAQEAQRMGDT